MYDVNNDNLNYDLSYICFVFCWVIYLQFLGYNMQSAITSALILCLVFVATYFLFLFSGVEAAGCGGSPAVES